MSENSSSDYNTVLSDSKSIENSTFDNDYESIIKSHQEKYVNFDLQLDDDNDISDAKKVSMDKEILVKESPTSDTEQLPKSTKRSQENVINADIESVISQTTQASKKSKADSLDGESRISYLTQVFSLLRAAINSGNEDQIEAIINESCVADCKFKTPALPVEVRGREFISRAYISVLRLHPDIILMETAPTVVDHRVITSATTMIGTRIGNDAANEFLYNLATPGVLIEQRTQFEDVRAAVVALMEAGQPISFRLKTYNHMVLNAEKTHIEKWIVIYRYITVSKANNI